MTERRRAPIEVLERLAEAVDAWYGMENTEAQPGWCDESKRMFAAMQAYRAATDPLRTRAEVDASKLHCASAYFNGNMGIDAARAEWARLCSEPTTDSGSSSATAAKESRDNAGVSAGPAKVTCHECGARGQPCVSRAQHVGHVIHCERLAGHPGRHQSDRLYWQESEALPPEPEALPWDAEDQRLADPCSCDEALELRRVVKHVHSLALEMARVTEGA